MSQIVKILLSFILLLVIVSCVSTATIYPKKKSGETDYDLKVYVDQKYLRNGYVLYQDKRSVFSPITLVKFKKEACQDKKKNYSLTTA